MKTNKIKIKEEFIQKVKTEKVGVICNTLEEIEVWYNFLDKHMDKDLGRYDTMEGKKYAKERRLGKVIANSTAYKNICEFSGKEYFSKKGYTIYNFKDIIEEETPQVNSQEIEVGDIVEFINPDSKNASYFKGHFTNLKVKGITSDRDYIHVYSEELKEAWYIDFDEVKLTSKRVPTVIPNPLTYATECPKKDTTEQQSQQEKYLVYVNGKGQPKVRHTYENAVKEAKRLSAKEVNKEVYVVQIMNTFKSEIIVNEI